LIRYQQELIKENRWNTLIVLDACRYDSFESVSKRVGIVGGLQPVNSRVTCTGQWYKKYWGGIKNFPDTVIVSGSLDPFDYGVHLNFRDHWLADKGGEVKLEYIVEGYREAVNGSRALVHFLPPHLPYIGPKGKELQARLGYVQPPWYQKKRRRFVSRFIRDYSQTGNHWAELRECYEESLEIVLSFIKENLSIFLKPVVITSDHGEMMGEGNLYGHHNRGHKEIQNTVPWMEVT
jgi:hypothetical protein